jgi:Tol biopolymer transport system component
VEALEVSPSEGVPVLADAGTLEGVLYLSTCPPGQVPDRYGCLDEAAPDQGPSHPPEILTQTADGERLQLTHNDLYESATLAWAPDGRRFAFAGRRSVYGEECRLYLVDLDLPVQIELPLTRWEEDSCHQPIEWSPDGDWLLMSKIVDDWATQLHRVRTDGSGVSQQLTGFWSDNQGAFGARWIREGRSIVYGWYSFRRSGITVMKADGSNKRYLKKFRDWGPHPRWLGGMAVDPGASRIAYTRGERRPEDNSYDAFLMRVDGRGDRRLARTRLDERGLSWSPNGRRLAMIQEDRAQSFRRMKILSLPSRETAFLVPHRGTDLDVWQRLRWSPSGRSIAFVAAREYRNAVFTGSVRDGSIIRVTGFETNQRLLDWRDG